jgi:hypothetical protein
LQEILDVIMRTCHSACSDDTGSANAITRELHRLLQQLVAAIDSELQSNPGNDIQTFSDSWRLLGKLVEGINRHFQIRPRIMFISEDADMQSAAAAARGIKVCFTRFIELLSSDEDRATNIVALPIFLMDTDGDAETSMRFAFLDIISRSVVAVKRPDQRWEVTIDGEIRHACSDDGASSGIDEIPIPFRKDNFDHLECPICRAALFQKEGDGRLVLLARQLKCPTAVDVTDRTPKGHQYPHVMCEGCAQRLFIEHKQTVCHQCRHNFREHLCVDIAAALEHQVDENGRVHWINAPQCRLAAFNVLAQLPVETPLGDSISYAVLRGCFDPAAGIAVAALRCRRLSVAIKVMPQAEARKWCATLVDAFKIAEIDSMRGGIAGAIRELIESQTGCTAFNAAENSTNTSGALVEALKIAETDDTRAHIAWVIGHCYCKEEGVAALIAAGGCGALVQALKIAETDDTRNNLAMAIGCLAQIEDGFAALIAASACGALVEALKVAETDRTRTYIALAISVFAEIEGGGTALIAASACCALVEALKIAETDDTRTYIADAIGDLAQIEEGFAALIAASACGALVEALKIAETDHTRKSVALAIGDLAQIEEGFAALIAASACGALVEALKVAETDGIKINILFAIGRLAENFRGREALIAAGACFALVEALKIAETDHVRKSIAGAIGYLAEIDAGGAFMIAAGACCALVEALKVAETVESRENIGWAIRRVKKNEERHWWPYQD